MGRSPLPRSLAQTELAGVGGARSTRGERGVMAQLTSGDRPMTRETRLGMAVTVEAEVMESRLDRDLDVGRAAAMTMDAGIEPPAVGIGMVADEAVDGHVLAVIEIQRQRLRTAQQRVAQREACTARDERSERGQRRGDDAG